MAQFDKDLKNCAYFYGILGPFLCAKFSVRKFGCAKEFTFRRSAQMVRGTTNKSMGRSQNCIYYQINYDIYHTINLHLFSA